MAQHALNVLQSSRNNNSQSPPSNLQSDITTTQVNTTILEMLQKQNELLEKIQTLLLNITEKDSEGSYHIRSRIQDIDISIGSMVAMSFKWLIASIPVGIVVGFLLFLLRACWSVR